MAKTQPTSAELREKAARIKDALTKREGSEELRDLELQIRETERAEKLAAYEQLIIAQHQVYLEAKQLDDAIGAADAELKVLRRRRHDFDVQVHQARSNIENLTRNISNFGVQQADMAPIKAKYQVQGYS